MKYIVEAEVTISITCEVEAKSPQEALKLAADMEMQNFCNQCCSADEAEAWTFSGELDGEAKHLLVQNPDSGAGQ